MVSPQAKRQAVEVLQAEHGFGVTRAVGWWRSLDRCTGTEAGGRTVPSCASAWARSRR